MEPAKGTAGVENLGQFRHLVTLTDGLRVCLRPIAATDREALLDLFTALPQEETQYFRRNVVDRDEIARWVQDLSFAHSFPLVAMAGNLLVGNCTLHLGSGTTRHVAEVRVFLDQQYRRRGIGSAMLKAQIDIARRLGLHQVYAEVTESRPQVIHAFEHLGFERHAVVRDLFITPDGDTLDLFLMVKFLRRASDDF